jgi:hypothetical protein
MDPRYPPRMTMSSPFRQSNGSSVGCNFGIEGTGIESTIACNRVFGGLPRNSRLSGYVDSVLANSSLFFVDGGGGGALRFLDLTRINRRGFVKKEGLRGTFSFGSGVITRGGV